jgi:hypothetical protein
MGYLGRRSYAYLVLNLVGPGILAVLACRTVLTLLQAWPTAAAVAAADRVELVQLVGAASQGQIGPTRVDALVATSRASVAARAVEGALAAKVRVLARRVATLDREIAELEDAIAAGFAGLGYRVTDFPVGGPVSLATILSEAGDMARYPSAKHVLSHFGWCPTDTQSGQYKDAHPRLSRAGTGSSGGSSGCSPSARCATPGPTGTTSSDERWPGRTRWNSLVAIGRKILTTISPS